MPTDKAPHTIRFRGTDYRCRSDETLLDAFLRQGADVPFSCGKGSCGVCMLRCSGGEIPPLAQQRIDGELAEKGYFLPCVCRPVGSMRVEPPRDADRYSPAVVAEKTLIGPDVCRLLLEPFRAITYRAGQFINLRRSDGLVRSYSLASVPNEDYYLELHVRTVPGGVMSSWIHDELAVGDEVRIQGPSGNNFYRPLELEHTLVLIGTGAGLAPLFGIARQALSAGHKGRIFLAHGALRASDLYHRAEIDRLAAQHPNLHYHPCLVDSPTTPWSEPNFLPDAALALVDDVKTCRIHLAGSSVVIDRALVLAQEAGIDADRVSYDAFESAEEIARANRHGSTEAAAAGAEFGPKFLPPDPEMWAALDQGRLLTRILTEFYDKVFGDDVLAPYFGHVTKQRLIEKTYSFWRQIFTGEQLYFGNRPRNAHHWMVIDDAIFDHREALMAACLWKHGLPEHLIQRWRAIEERFRRDIVKRAPWNRFIDGAAVSSEGFAEDELAYSTQCDACQAEVEAGTRVRYHLRLGKVYCARCSGEPTAARSAGTG